jgi:DNA-binding transcriptional ArsR family regulator
MQRDDPMAIEAVLAQDPDVDAMAARAKEASEFLKALAHEGRLMILCHLLEGEKSVSELESLIGARQAAVSQQLARLRLEGLVTARRDGKAIFYALGDRRVRRLIETMHVLFCGDAARIN